ncbi:hypothetical protein AVEN_88377-1 [Araneus ventricosus]|uniref:Uncharacterized protein n=1 Tax=Araneus ventricosus TaxID=182803 RepID=A0A4Y2GFV3_ARAVE|nr:hypothetical protein AVEN_88377-1 [Araneus ventricosus]
MSQRRQSNRKNFHNEKHLEPWMQRSMDNNSWGSQRGKLNQGSRRSQNTPSFNKNVDSRSPPGKPEHTKHKMCRDATVNGVPGFYTPDGDFYPYKPSPTLDSNMDLNKHQGFSSQLDSTNSTTPEPSSNRNFQGYHLPSTSLATLHLFNQESPSTMDLHSAPVAPQGGSTSLAKSITISPVQIQPPATDQIVGQTPLMDNDNTINYYSTPSSEKSIPPSSLETTPLNKQSSFHYLAQKEEEDATTELEIVYTSVKSTTAAASFMSPHSTKGILEIYSSLDGQEKVEFLETLNARERQALYNMLKDTPKELQEWEQLFKTLPETSKATFASIHSQEQSPSNLPLMQHISITSEKEDLN